MIEIATRKNNTRNLHGRGVSKTQSREGKQNLARFHIGAGEKMKQCKNCGKDIPDSLTFCSEECTTEYKKKSTKTIVYSGSGLEEIYDHLDLNEAKDGRLVIKADIMKKAIYLMSKWKIGKKREWVDKLSIFTCVSTRKIREDYVQPLITIGILVEFNDTIKFVGLPK